MKNNGSDGNGGSERGERVRAIHQAVTAAPTAMHARVLLPAELLVCAQISPSLLSLGV